MDYIYQSDLADYHTSKEAVLTAKKERDAYAAITLGLSEPIVYTKALYEYFDIYTYREWLKLDKEFCRKAVETYCTIAPNKAQHKFILVSNGLILYAREQMPTEEEKSEVYKRFLRWNGSRAAPEHGGYPHRMYLMMYMPVESPPPSPVLRRSDRLAEKERVNYRL